MIARDIIIVKDIFVTLFTLTVVKFGTINLEYVDGVGDSVVSTDCARGNIR